MRWRIALATPLALANGDAMAPENAERLVLAGRAARASDSLVEEVKRCWLRHPPSSWAMGMKALP